MNEATNVNIVTKRKIMNVLKKTVGPEFLVEIFHVFSETVKIVLRIIYFNFYFFYLMVPKFAF